MMFAEAECQRQTHDRIHNPIAQQYFDLLTNAGVVTYPLNHKVDLSLKQCIHDHADDLLPRLIKPNLSQPILPRKQAWPRAVAARKERERQRSKRLAAESGVRLLFKDGEWLRYKRNASLSFGDIELIREPVSIKSTRQRPNQCSPTRTGRYELTVEECTKIARRIVNYLNRAIFGKSSRRRHNRTSITALIVVHSKGTRLHFHMLFGIPDHVTDFEFRAAFNRATEKEQFAYKKRKFGRITSTEHLATVINYNVAPHKSITGDPVVLVTYQQRNHTEGEMNDQNQRIEEDRNGVSSAAA